MRDILKKQTNSEMENTFTNVQNDNNEVKQVISS